MEECLFRAVPLSLGALIGAHFGRKRAGIAIAFVLQALVFGAAHANYPGFPSYSRLVELIIPSMIWAAIFLRFGLLPTIILHACFDLSLFAIPLFLVAARRLAECVTDERLARGALYPPVTELRTVTRAIATNVARTAASLGITRAGTRDPAAVDAAVNRAMWWPDYVPYVPAEDRRSRAMTLL